MVHYTLERLAGEPIILGQAFADWNSTTDLAAFTHHLLILLREASEPVYWIADMTAWKPDMGELIITAHEIARTTNAIARHPKLRQVIVISQNRAVELSAKGLNSQAFGFVSIACFPAVEAALTYARERVNLPTPAPQP
jgi:hypothetical protein